MKLRLLKYILLSLPVPTASFVGFTLASHPNLPRGSYLASNSFWISMGYILPAFLLCGLIGIILLIFALLRWKKRENRNQLALIGIILLLNFTGCYFTMNCGWPLRKNYMENATVIGAQIIDSITKYKQDNGEYPETLDQLVPEYLSEIPETGMNRYPEFEYKRSATTDIKLYHDHFETGGYQIVIIATTGLMENDFLVYCPNEEYPDDLEDINEWAYNHEYAFY